MAGWYPGPMPDLSLTVDHDGLSCHLGDCVLTCDLHRLTIGGWSVALADVTYVRVGPVLKFVEVGTDAGIRRWYVANDRGSEGLARLGSLLETAVAHARDPGGPTEIPAALQALISP